MNNCAWRFPRLDNGELTGFNNSGIQTFVGSNLYESLAREICQNSLDAVSNSNEPVVVKFKMKELEINKFDALKDLRVIFKKCEEFWKDEDMDSRFKDFIDEAYKILNSQNINTLVVSDYNTKGLSGARLGPYKKTVFNALTGASGMTVKSDTTSAGSFGIGKNAPFVCSKLHTIFYNTYAEDDNEHAFKGVSRLVTHYEDYDGKQEATQGVGFYQNVVNKRPIFSEDFSLFRDQFSRDEYGTDVIIAGFRNDQNWQVDIEKAILKNFFAAIHQNKLVVEIEDVVIDKDTIGDKIKFYARDEERNDVKNGPMKETADYYETLTDPDFEIKGEILEKNDAHLYIKIDDGYNNRIAKMRNSGMIIESPKKNMLVRYSAVMIAIGARINTTLKEMENPTHDKWDPGNIEHNELKRSAAERTRRRLNKWINDSIREMCKSEDTDELDLAGISQFLPFNEDDISLGTNEKETKEVDGKTSLGEVTIKKKKVSKINLIATKTSGIPNEESGEREPSENPGGNSHLHGGKPDPNSDRTIVVPNEGDRAIPIPKIIKQRIFKTPAGNAYRAVFVLEEDCKKVHIKLRSVGDDGNKENIFVKEYKVGKTKQVVNSSEIVLYDIKGKENTEFFVYLDDNETLQVALEIY